MILEGDLAGRKPYLGESLSHETGEIVDGTHWQPVGSAVYGWYQKEKGTLSAPHKFGLACAEMIDLLPADQHTLGISLILSLTKVLLG